MSKKHFEMFQSIAQRRNPGTNKPSNDKDSPNRINSDDMADFSSNSRFDDITEMRHEGSVVSTIRTNSALKPSRAKQGKFSQNSLLLRRVFDSNPRVEPKMQLEIQSPSLCQEFAKLAKNITTIQLYGEPIIIGQPFREIFYCRDEIERVWKESEPGSEKQKELQLLRTFQDDYMSETIQAANRAKSTGNVEFCWLWTSFRPGITVVLTNSSASSNDVKWYAHLKAFEYQRQDLMDIWAITIVHTDFNGTKFGKTERTVLFPGFTGITEISSLQAYPEDIPEQRKELEDLGKLYEQYCLSSIQCGMKSLGTSSEHDGPIWIQRFPERDIRDGCNFTDYPFTSSNGRVIVDFEGFFKHCSLFRPKIVPFQGQDNPELKGRRQLCTDELVTCPPLVPVYSFAAKQWCYVLIRDLKPIQWDTGLMGEVQLDSKLKDIIKALARGFTASERPFDDFVAGKGRGLVCLLQGEPGSGKTMLAESVSEYVERPILQLSGGDLGSSVQSTQRALADGFALAARWGAILLLDEADAFLSKRDGTNLERNALTAVFLRLIEYQSSIVFLTTNRCEDIDSAFESRLHLNIELPPLSEESRQQIWKRLATKNGFELKIEHLDELEGAQLSQRPLNGRQIKNILRLAHLMATSRLSKDTQGHACEEAIFCFADIKQILELQTAFYGKIKQEMSGLKQNDPSQ